LILLFFINLYANSRYPMFPYKGSDILEVITKNKGLYIFLNYSNKRVVLCTYRLDYS